MAYHVKIKRKDSTMLNIGIVSETAYNSLFPAMKALAKRMGGELFSIDIDSFEELNTALVLCNEDFNL